MASLDNLIFLWLNATPVSPAWLVPLARLASVELPQWLVAGTAGALVVGDAGTRRVVLRVLCAMAVAWMLARIGQHVLHVPRPFVLGLGTLWMPHGDSAGFPSTHASVAFAFAFVLASSLPTHRRKWGAAALAAAGLIGWSRICLGLHFPSDVLVGAAVGAAGAWASGWMPKTAPRVRTAHE